MAHPVKVAEADMGKFVTRLKLDLPANIKVHNVAMNALTGRWSYSEFWVDCWPDFNGAIAVPSKDAISIFCGVYLLCGTEASAKFLLKHCVKWDPPIEFHGLHEDLYPALVEAAKAHGVVETICRDYSILGASDLQENTSTRPALMEGYSTKSLCSEQLPDIVKNWPDAVLFRNPAEFLEILSSRFPSVGVFDCHGDLAAYAGLYHYGGVAFLAVGERHRRKGIGKFVVSEMYRIAKHAGIIPHSNIACGNDVAVKLHRAIDLLPLTEKCEKFVFYKTDL